MNGVRPIRFHEVGGLADLDAAGAGIRGARTARPP